MATSYSFLAGFRWLYALIYLSLLCNGRDGCTREVVLSRASSHMFASSLLCSIASLIGWAGMLLLLLLWMVLNTNRKLQSSKSWFDTHFGRFLQPRTCMLDYLFLYRDHRVIYLRNMIRKFNVDGDHRSWMPCSFLGECLFWECNRTVC